MKRRREKGSAILEFAMSLIVLLAICMGAADFARVFYHGITLVDAGSTGATFGAFRPAHSNRYSEMRSIANSASIDVSSSSTVTISADRYCDCPGAPATSPTHANAVSCSSTCAGYGLPRVYVRTATRQTFRTVASYPLLPNTINTGVTAYRRVQ